jgi:hypothetical protein
MSRNVCTIAVITGHAGNGMTSVVLPNSDGQWWSAESVGVPLLPGLREHIVVTWRQDAWCTDMKERGGIYTRLMNTIVANHRTMRSVVEWMLARSTEHYHLAKTNCQNFASALTNHLTGIGVARTMPSSGRSCSRASCGDREWLPRAQQSVSQPNGPQLTSSVGSSVPVCVKFE